MLSLTGFRAILACFAAAWFLVLGMEARAVVFDDGADHTIDANNSFPFETVIVLNASSSLTRVFLVPGGEVGTAIPDGDLVSRDNSWVTMTGGEVGDDLSGEGTTSSFVFFGGGVVGELQAGGISSVAMSGGTVLNSAFAAEQGGLGVEGGVITGDLVASGDSTVNILGGTIQGDVLQSSAEEMSIRGGTIAGSLEATQAGIVKVSGGVIGGDLRALGDSLITIVGIGFNFPAGDVAALSGTLTGTLADLTPLNIDFERASTATIHLEDFGELDILRVVGNGGNGVVAAYADIDDFITNQNGMVLGPGTSAFATARGFFSDAGKFYAVLGDGTIVRYSNVLDFANDVNGTVIDTVPEYAIDAGYVGVAPIPVISAPALSHSGRAALTALLIGAAGFVFARRRRA